MGQCGDAGGEQAPHLVLFAGVQVGEHVLLDAANRVVELAKSGTKVGA